MLDIIGSILVLVLGVGAAYWSGKRTGKKQEKLDNETDDYNEYVATKARIDAAARPDLSDADVADSLRDHAK
jgi:hypothetical protein|tara:strand:+ start:270 stop:485 length:216 start_codon:yes stop_codon:yes gene_type:complete